MGARAKEFSDPIDTPAQATQLLTRSQLAAVARVGSRLVAVGVRGRIMTSDDGGRSWVQAKVPVSVELVGVQFVGSKEGWAVGHGGVMLHSSDAGSTWQKQLDGRQTQALLQAHFKPKADAGDQEAARMLSDVELNYAEGPEQALLGVWFEDLNNGFACGSFGTLLATRDGGKTWESWVERIDAREPLHLNAIRGVGNEIFIASERGKVFRLDRQAQRFVQHETGYRGSFFGVVGSESMVIAYGLRGSAYRSVDEATNWRAIDLGVGATINGGTVLDDGRILLVTQDGQALLGDAEGLKFRSLPLAQRGLFQDAVQIDRNSALLVGWSGPQVISLQ